MTLAVWLSLAVSLALGLMPFALPTIPIGAVIMINWILFMAVGFWASPKPLRVLPPYQKMEPAKLKAFRLVFLAFTAAGWVAIFNAEAV